MQLPKWTRYEIKFLTAAPTRSAAAVTADVSAVTRSASLTTPRASAHLV